jgi:hypothetical protein
VLAVGLHEDGARARRPEPHHLRLAARVHEPAHELGPAHGLVARVDDHAVEQLVVPAPRLDPPEPREVHATRASEMSPHGVSNDLVGAGIEQHGGSFCMARAVRRQTLGSPAARGQSGVVIM